MRILHTSDWHLGQHFYGKSRAAEHEAFTGWLLKQVDDYQIDAVVIAGDIFDTGAPPSYARELYHRILLQLNDASCQTVVLAGNHDSVAVLNEASDLLRRLNTHVIASVSETPSQQIITLSDRQGQPGAIVCAIPFVRPRDVINSVAGQSGEDKQLALQQAIALHYQQLFELAKSEQSKQTAAIPIIATGHLTTVGASTSDSVRDIYIGTLEAFPAQAFPEADYIALGHIHRSQRIAGQEHIRYSGSPIPLSFDELSQDKSVLMSTFVDGKLESVKPLTIPLFQAMKMVKGTFEEIENQLTSLNPTNNEAPTWLDIEVTSTEYLSDLQSRIQELTAELPVEVLLLRRQRDSQNSTLESDLGESLNELTAEEVFERRLALTTIESEEERSRAERLRQHYRQLLVELDLKQPAPVADKQAPKEPLQGSLL